MYELMIVFVAKTYFPKNTDITLLKRFSLFLISTSAFLFMIKYLKEIEKKKKVN